MRGKSTLSKLIRPSVSLIALALVVRFIEPSVFLGVISRISFSTIAFVAFLYTLGQLASVVKWSCLLRSSGITRPFSEILASYFLGMFVNTFGLGTVGGDAVRSLAIGRAKGKKATAFATVIADRVHGLTVLSIIGILGVFLANPFEGTPSFLSFMHDSQLTGPMISQNIDQSGAVETNSVLAIAVGSALFIGLALGWWVGPSLLQKVFPPEHRLGSMVQRIALGFPRQFHVLLEATLLSVVLHALQIVIHVVIARALGVPLPLTLLLAIVPIVNIASSLPLSINGVGVREALYLFFFSARGIPPETAIAFGAIWICAVTIVSAIGGLAVTMFSPEIAKYRTSPATT